MTGQLVWSSKPIHQHGRVYINARHWTASSLSGTLLSSWLWGKEHERRMAAHRKGWDQMCARLRAQYARVQ